MSTSAGSKPPCNDARQKLWKIGFLEIERSKTADTESRLLCLSMSLETMDMHGEMDGMIEEMKKVKHEMALLRLRFEDDFDSFQQEIEDLREAMRVWKEEFEFIAVSTDPALENEPTIESMVEILSDPTLSPSSLPSFIQQWMLKPLTLSSDFDTTSPVSKVSEFGLTPKLLAEPKFLNPPTPLGNSCNDQIKAAQTKVTRRTRLFQLGLLPASVRT